MAGHHVVELRQVSVDTSAVELAQELTEARERLGLTQKELADLLATTEETVSNWERGVTKRPRGLQRIRATLGLEAPTEGPSTHQLDDELLWRQFRETVNEIERRFYRRHQPNQGPSGTRTPVPAHLTTPPSKRLSPTDEVAT